MKTLSLWAGIIGLCLLLAACEEGEEEGDGLLLSLANYLPEVAGDSLWYQGTTGSDQVLLAFSQAQVVARDSLPLIRRAYSHAEDRVQQFRRDKGLYLYQYEDGARSFVFNEPVRLFPAWMVLGDTHVVAMDYAVLEGEAVRTNGRATFMTILEGIKPVETPFRAFPKSIVLRSEVVRTDASGAESGYAVREWYAEMVGLVKAEGTVFWTDEHGARTSTAIDHELVRAKIRGELSTPF